MNSSGARRLAAIVVTCLIPLTVPVSPASAASAPDPVPAGVDPFALHSNPGATKTLYLDFTGQRIEGTGFNDPDLYGMAPTDAPPFDFDNNPVFSASERDYVYNAWAVVAEDYAPLDVDVTTQEPSWNAINRDSTGDQRFGTWLIITPDTASNDIQAALCGSCAGYSEIGWVDSTYNGYRYSFRFPQKQTATWPQGLGSVSSHELGHSLGLTHDSSPSTTGWGPVMGNNHSYPYTVFSAGEYDGATNTQDDFAVMAANGIPLRADDHGDAPQAADPLPRGATVTGIITTRTDKDVFKVVHSCAGNLTLTEHGAQPAGNLDAQLRLLDSNGNELASDNPALAAPPDNFHSNLGLDATISTNQPAGTYYVEVDGVGVQSGSAGPLPTDYGSRGRYTLAHSSACTGAQVPGEPSSVTATPGTDGTSIQLGWSAPATDGGSPVTGYAVQRPDGSMAPVGSVLTHTVTGLATDTVATFRVWALNAAGAGAVSQISATPTYTPTPPPPPPAPPSPPVPPTTVPGAPRIGRAYAGTVGGRSTAKAVWAAPTSNGGAAITAYRITAMRLSPSGAVVGKRTFSAAASKRSLVMALTRGKYRFVVVALNRVGGSKASARSIAVRAR